MAAKKRTTKAAAKASKSKKSKAKPAKKASPKARPAAKSAKKPSRTTPAAKQAAKKTVKKTPTAKKSSPAKKKAMPKKAATRRAPARKSATKPAAKPARPLRKSTFSAAVKVYESALELVHSEKFDRAKTKFNELITRFPSDTELLERAHVLIQACDKRILEMRSGPRLKTADDFYDVGVAELNGRNLDASRTHLEKALKLEPNADYVLYALAAVLCLSGERDQSLAYLRSAIQQRDQNRFQATNDADFSSLFEDPEFLDLTTSQ